MAGDSPAGGPSAGLEVSAAAGESGPVLVLSGRAGPGSADRLRELLVTQAGLAARRVTVDVSGLAGADPAAVRVLVAAARLLRERGGWLILLDPQPEVARLLRVEGAGKVMVVRRGKPAGAQGPPRQQAAGSENGLPAFDPTVPNAARMWNYWVGGKDHFTADRDAAQNVLAAMPALPLLARITRRFLIDVVGELAGQRGVRQFLDVGTGLPTADNTHHVAQRAAPGSRIVYVDHDPVVLSHARALLTSSPQGKTDYLQADLRDTGTIVSGAARTLDFRQPVAVLLIAVLHFIPDADDPYAIVARLMDAVPSGSYLVIAHWAGDIQPGAVAEATRRYNQRSSTPITPRDRDEVARFFDGLEFTGRGLVPIGEWWEPGRIEAAARGLPGHCGVARKP